MPHTNTIRKNTHTRLHAKSLGGNYNNKEMLATEMRNQAEGGGQKTKSTIAGQVRTEELIL